MPATSRAFVEAVFAAEGPDADAAHGRLVGDVRRRVDGAYRQGPDSAH